MAELQGHLETGAGWFRRSRKPSMLDDVGPVSETNLPGWIVRPRESHGSRAPTEPGPGW